MGDQGFGFNGGFETSPWVPGDNEMSDFDVKMGLLRGSDDPLFIPQQQVNAPIITPSTGGLNFGTAQPLFGGQPSITPTAEPFINSQPMTPGGMSFDYSGLNGNNSAGLGNSMGNMGNMGGMSGMGSMGGMGFSTPKNEQNVNMINNPGNMQASPSLSFEQVIAVSPEEKQQYQSAIKLIQDILQVKVKQKEQLEQIRHQQVKFLQGDPTVGHDQLSQAQEGLLQQIRYEIQRLTECCCSVVFEADVHFVMVNLIRDLRIQGYELRLLQEECRNINNPQVLASIVIEEQPLSQVIFKTKQTFEPYGVRLITSTMAPIEQCSAVSVFLQARKDDKSKRKVPNLNNGLIGSVSEMDRMQKRAVFHSLKASVSTSMHMVNNIFTMQIKSQGVVQTLESRPSNTFVVITNESQWSQAAGKIFMVEVFAGQDQTQAAWPQVANKLHSIFVTATRQKPQCPTRPLQLYEFKYLRSKYVRGLDSKLTRNQATALWNWFGPVMQCIRFKRHVCTLWQKGYIFGFLTKDTCSSILGMYPAGTFMIRFSESNPGLFGLAYVEAGENGGQEVQHYLVKEEDTGSNKSLPDFIREKSQFVQLLTLPNLQLLPKDEAFLGLYAKRRRTRGDGPPVGYSDLK